MTEVIKVEKLIVDIQERLDEAEKVYSGKTSETYTKGVICGRFKRQDVVDKESSSYYKDVRKQFDIIVSENKDRADKEVTESVDKFLGKLEKFESIDTVGDIYINVGESKDEFVTHEVKIAYDLVSGIDTMEKAEQFGNYMKQFGEVGAEDYDIWIIVKCYVPMFLVLRQCTESSEVVESCVDKYKEIFG